MTCNPAPSRRASKVAALISFIVPLVVFPLPIVFLVMANAGEKSPLLWPILLVLGSVLATYVAGYPLYRLIAIVVFRAAPAIAPWISLRPGSVWVGCLAASLSLLVLIPLASGVHSRVRLAKAQADTRAITAAVHVYLAHCGRTPGIGAGQRTNCPTQKRPGVYVAAALVPLTATQTNDQGHSAGPFLRVIPTPPPGWTPYLYVLGRDGSFAICAMGEGMTVGSNSDTPCGFTALR